MNHYYTSDIIDAFKDYAKKHAKQSGRNESFYTLSIKVDGITYEQSAFVKNEHFWDAFCGEPQFMKHFVQYMKSIGKL